MLTKQTAGELLARVVIAPALAFWAVISAGASLIERQPYWYFVVIASSAFVLALLFDAITNLKGFCEERDPE